jgi:hypothetical protein
VIAVAPELLGAGALFLAYGEKGLVDSSSLPALWRRPGWLKASTGAGFAWRENGSVCLSDGTLAGSTLTMDQAVRNAVRSLGISLEDGVRMASETPAEILGLS